MTALRITDLAALAGTTVRALRYYEDLGLLEPQRSATRARYYPPDTAAIARQIVDMRRLGIPVAAIAEALDGLKTDRPSLLENLLLRRREEMEAEKAIMTGLLEQARQATATRRSSTVAPGGAR
ncbi:MerR family transcriptional regulator [Brevundimonas sp.]|uniref:MerR family transcriptional regulator n=1 Tax=Brevundimonas sp. TaxID=1871086 RepID=UPI003D6D20BD